MSLCKRCGGPTGGYVPMCNSCAGIVGDGAAHNGTPRCVKCAYHRCDGNHVPWTEPPSRPASLPDAHLSGLIQRYRRHRHAISGLGEERRVVTVGPEIHDLLAMADALVAYLESGGGTR